LVAAIIAVAAVGFYAVLTALRERSGALAAVERNGSHQPFVAQVTQVRFAQAARRNALP
jgi:hypothetical protein